MWQCINKTIDIFYDFMNITPREDLEEFFKEKGLKNDKGKYPKQVKITEGEMGDLYHIKIPKNIKFEDFKKYEYDMSVYYNRSVQVNDINTGGKYITIELYHPKYTYNLEEFFKNAGLKNSFGGEIKQDFTEYKKGTITCYMSNQDGLTTEDFEKYKPIIEDKYYCNMEIKNSKGKIKIYLHQRK